MKRCGGDFLVARGRPRNAGHAARSLFLALVASRLAGGSLAASPAEAASVSGASFYTVSPCRLIDTRGAIGAYGAPSLAANVTRTFVFDGQCGIASAASAISFSVTVAGASTAGVLQLAPSGASSTGTAALSYQANGARASNAIIATGPGGDIAATCIQASGACNLVVDVNGYFATPGGNQRPVANAGPAQNITLPGSAQLAGSATDDGKPNGTLTYSWSEVGGPGPVAFSNAAIAAPTATFSAPGVYTLRLTVSDSALTGTSDVVIGVNPPSTANPTFDAVRLLEQSTWGPTDALVTHVLAVGPAGFLAEQFATPSTGYPSLALWPNDAPASCDSTCYRTNYTMYPLQRQMFTNALYGADQLRQRVEFALHKLLVVSGLDITMPSRMTPYLQALDRNAFGNFRQLLADITLNPAMGEYLNMDTSTKYDPNENYAREVMQLFSVGTALLNPDGTPQLDPTGIANPTYDQSAVTNLARVFTGWRLSPDLPYPPDPNNSIDDYVTPMVFKSYNHDTGSKTLLDGSVIPAGQSGNQDLNQALDVLFNHPNAGPYLATQLIRQLVTSNPTPAYVGRVAAVFNDNGWGVRGDLKAVVAAILLDSEARGDLKTDPNYGHLKEPALFVANVLRVFQATGDGSPTSDGYLNPQTSSMGQDVFRPPTVFSYFPAGFAAPGTSLVGPEFGIESATTALKRANFVNTMVFFKIAKSSNPTTGNAPLGTALDFTRLLPFADDPQALVDELNRLLLHGSMSTSATAGANNMNDSVVQAVSAISCASPCSGTGALARVQQAAYLVASSSQYQVQR